MFREAPYLGFANIIENENQVKRPSLRTPDNPARLAWREWARKIQNGASIPQDRWATIDKLHNG